MTTCVHDKRSRTNSVTVASTSWPPMSDHRNEWFEQRVASIARGSRDAEAIAIWIANIGARTSGTRSTYCRMGMAALAHRTMAVALEACTVVSRASHRASSAMDPLQVLVGHAESLGSAQESRRMAGRAGGPVDLGEGRNPGPRQAEPEMPGSNGLTWLGPRSMNDTFRTTGRGNVCPEQANIDTETVRDLRLIRINREKTPSKKGHVTVQRHGFDRCRTYDI